MCIIGKEEEVVETSKACTHNTLWCQHYVTTNRI